MTFEEFCSDTGIVEKEKDAFRKYVASEYAMPIELVDTNSFDEDELQDTYDDFDFDEDDFDDEDDDIDDDF